MANIPDAWSRRTARNAVGRSIEARLVVAALKVTIEQRHLLSEVLADHGIVGPVSRRGDPYNNAEAERFRKTLKVETVYPMAFETLTNWPSGFLASLKPVAINAA